MIRLKIEKYSKNKNGMYLLTLENGTKVKIHENLILKYGLLLNKQLNDKLLKKLNQENQFYEVYEIALKYINIRLRSCKELMEYLKKKEYEIGTIDSVIDLLKTQGYLDDRIYATSFVHDRILMSNYGPLKIKGELEKYGIPNDLIEDVIVSFDEELERDKIKKLVDKQIKSNHNKGAMVLRRKIQTYLLGLGYSNVLINQVLNGKKLVDNSIFQKEYDKLYTKLSKKYSGKELEYKLKQKMYQKGFQDFSSE